MDIPVCIPIVKAIVQKDGRILIGKKDPNEPHPIRGQWHLPGGIIDRNEQPEVAMIREIKEETDLDIRIDKLILVEIDWDPKDLPEHFVQEPRLFLTYLCSTINDNQAKAQDDIVEVKWVEPKEAINELNRSLEITALKTVFNI